MGEAEAVSETLSEPNLHIGLLAIRNEFLNISELKHCLDVRKKHFQKNQQVLDLGDVLVQQRYLTPQDLEYLLMIAANEAGAPAVALGDIEAEFDRHVAELKPGADFGEFVIEEEIGRGGMGIVFRARSRDKDEPCALKILIGGKDATVRDIERFKKEATVMAPLIHPGIVKILEVGRHKGLDFIAMEFVDGVSLKELVGDKALGDDTALLVIRSASEAVAFMHSHGIIHRDIKPENIMVRPDGSAALMDFGLAGWDKIEILAGRGSIGTPMYQPPEQAEVGGPFGKISEASDVYGLGATLYFLLTARHPFLGKTVQEVRAKIKAAAPDPITASSPKVHAAAEALCLRCLKKRQNERFGTPKELIEHIDKVLGILLPNADAQKQGRTRLLRRIQAAVRVKSDAGPTPGKRPEGAAPAGPKARRSDAGKVKRPAASTDRGKPLPGGPARRPRRPGQPSDGGPILRPPAGPGGLSTGAIVAIATAGVCVVIVGLLLLSR